ncbi:putative lipoprotein [Methylomonas sp. SURF-2]|uniref:Lipoprotein n=1 Tax=Methylomonas subterranea TaxID=2952225 RepID=A0ABT1TJN1_9GAMM|nr:putative lipoprotein [Methylomonas sp. SURF-2]MCQ8105453.1 putative lipoprotein [Methylomonas sp. SURF-2]
MSGFKTFLQSIALPCLLLALNACSFSHSSESSSDSLGSVSDLASSPSSISSSKNSKKYQADVLDYTYAYVKSSSDASDYNDFQKGLAEIAERHGISDWEDDPLTYRAMGKALKKARIDGVGYETFKKNFADGDSEKMRLIQEGYDNQK